MVGRMAVLGLVLVGGGVYVQKAAQPQRVVLVQPLAGLPLRIGEWQGRDAPRFSPAVLDVLGVDDYLNRVYARPADPEVAFYVGYYQNQQHGDAIHSPMNCMPGAGWEPVEHALTPLLVQSGTGELRTVVVNEYVVQKGTERQLVLYWYHSHGRVVASEYKSRIYMVYDAIRQHRTDAALVRVVTPIGEFVPESRQRAAERAGALVRSVFPHLSAMLAPRGSSAGDSQ